MIEIKHLKTLTTLRETGSLTATANALYLTQSALSHQFRELESRLGSPLFLRKTRPVRFTPEGLILLGLADDILPKLHLAEHQLTHLKAESTGRLHMAIDCHSCFQWLMPALKSFQQHWPEVTLDFSSGFAFDPIPALSAGELDLVITSDVQTRHDVYYHPLFDFEMRVIVSPNSPFATQTQIYPEDFLDSTLISYPVAKNRLDVVKHFLQPAHCEPKNWKHADNTLMLIQMVSANLGIAVLPNWAITEFAQQKLVVSLPLGEGLWRRLFAAIRYNEQSRHYLQAFFSTAQSHCQEHLSDIKSI